ncbi:MAG: DUF3267 domain-containing protein [Firmicutes bacterium]|nr:DUF3267 domain-containing protein [Bacillota bacterium]
MIFHYKGKFSGNPDDLPCSEHEPNAVKYKEPDDPKKLALIANGISVVLFILTIAIYLWRAGGLLGEDSSLNYSIWGCLLSLVTLFPHEMLHALCFRSDVYMYTNFKQGMAFVVGPERMSKAHFILMSMLPNIVFGFIPFIIFMIFAKSGAVTPILKLVGTMGAFCIPMGAGDYLNVFNTLTQVPKGGKVYMHKFNSYWYMPEDRCS